MPDFISFFFPSKSKGKIDSISFDLVRQENHSFSNDVTSYPIETGKEITDNIVAKPMQLTMNGIITDTPLLDFTEPDQIFNEIFDEGRSQAIFKQLRALRDSRTVFTVITGLEVYELMTFTQLDISRNQDTGKSFNLNAQMQQVEFADAKTIIVPPDKIAKRPDADQKDRGNSTDDKGIVDKINKGNAKKFIDSIIPGKGGASDLYKMINHLF